MKKKVLLFLLFAFLVFPAIIAIGISREIVMVQFGALLLYLPLFTWAITAAS